MNSVNIAPFCVVFCFGVASGLCATGNRVHLVKEYKADGAALVDISEDGRLILTEGSRVVPCSNSASRCRVSVLAVYNAKTGKKVGEQVSADEGQFLAATFLPGNRVSALSMTWDRTAKKSLRTLLHWDPFGGTRIDQPWLDEPGLWPLCQVDDGRVFGMITEKPTAPRMMMKLADSDGLHSLQQPPIPFQHVLGSPQENTDPLYLLMHDNCSSWRSGSSYLIQGQDPSGTLYWIATDAKQPFRACCSSPRERIHGYAVSPDGNIIALVTGTGDLPIGSAGYRVFLNVVEGGGCNILRKLPLEFPENPGRTGPLLHPREWPDRIKFLRQFATHVAISPDRTKVAIAYGLFDSPDGVAYFGLYSLDDGRRLATLRGDSYRGGVWRALLHNSEDIWQSSAPINGALRFSPDSAMLFATSAHVYQWDVSALR